MDVISCKKPNIDREITNLFAEAIRTKDIKSIQTLLSDEGTFEIQSPRLNSLQVNKKRFLSWIKKRMKETETLTITFDQCLHCSIGATVILINDGNFPRQIKDSSERSKHGLMHQINNGLINEIKFCYIMAETENDFVYEVKMKRIKQLQEQGLDVWQAMSIIEKEKESNVQQGKLDI